MSRIVFTFIVCSFCGNLVGQEPIKVVESCSWNTTHSRSQIFGFKSEIDALDAVDQIMSYTGLPTNFIIREGDVDNASAIVAENNRRYIVYNKYWMDDLVRRSGTDWSKFSVLAHEIGHHLSNHMMGNVGSRHEQELQADKFSGFILAKMGASLNQARASEEALYSEASWSHPASPDRLKAITQGWNEANDTQLYKGNKTNIDPIVERSRIDNILVYRSSFKMNQAIVLNFHPSAIGQHLRFYYDFDIEGAKGIDLYLFTLFARRTRKGLEFLIDQDGRYYDPSGRVRFSYPEMLNPDFSNAYYELEQLIPFKQLHLKKGKHTLVARALLTTKTGRVIKRFADIHIKLKVNKLGFPDPSTIKIY